MDWLILCHCPSYHVCCLLNEHPVATKPACVFPWCIHSLIKLAAKNEHHLFYIDNELQSVNKYVYIACLSCLYCPYVIFPPINWSTVRQAITASSPVYSPLSMPPLSLLFLVAFHSPGWSVVPLLDCSTFFNLNINKFIVSAFKGTVCIMGLGVGLWHLGFRF